MSEIFDLIFSIMRLFNSILLLTVTVLIVCGKLELKWIDKK